MMRENERKKNKTEGGSDGSDEKSMQVRILSVLL